jgi:hypothetical protein
MGGATDLAFQVGFRPGVVEMAEHAELLTRYKYRTDMISI